MARPGKKRDRLTNAGGFGLNAESFCVDTFDPKRPEESFCKMVTAAHRKHWGQYFTPEPVAALMARWVAVGNPLTVLDPCVGPGILVRHLKKLLPDTAVTGLDIDPVALEVARRSLVVDTTISLIRQDFLRWSGGQSFHGAIANPPYLNHHNLLYDGDIFGEVGERNGVHVSKMANVYVLFVLEMCRRLEIGGRAAILLPAEWMNANFGVALKGFLLDRGLLKALVTFAHTCSVFQGVLTTTSLLLIEKPPLPNAGNILRVFHCDTDSQLASLRLDVDCHHPLPEQANVLARDVSYDELKKSSKWNGLIHHPLARYEEGFVPLSCLASTKRGLASGANSFFLLSKERAERVAIRTQNLLPCVGRAAHAKGAVFEPSDLDRLVAEGKPVYLLRFVAPPDVNEEAYLTQGVAAGLPDRYLLSKRDPWYAQESRPPSAIWVKVFGRSGVRFILNRAGTSNLTTFHCIYPHSDCPTFAQALVVLLNSPPVQSMLRSHVRIYGGGLYKLEPRDLLHIPVPDLNRVSQRTLLELASLLPWIDSRFRAGQDLAKGPEGDLLGLLVRKAAFEAVSGVE